MLPIGVLARRSGGFLVIFYFVWYGLRKKIGDFGFFFFFFFVACCVLVVVVLLVVVVGVADGRGGCGRFYVCFF